MKKLTFLVLHLGTGGIETATLNTCNALCDKYDIEVISFYKLTDDISNKFNSKIKITYLYDGGPNRNEFKAALKNHQYIGLIKEGIKATNILYKKKSLMIKAIKQINNGVIVSTRMEFNVLLSKYGHKNVLKIGQEHQYHNNDQKYINNIKNKYKNLDYLFALTTTLKKDYEEFLKGTKVKVVVMPNMLEQLSPKKAPLDSDMIISVGRFHEVKRFPLLLDVFSKLNNNVKLVLVGDGEQKAVIEDKINKLKLQDRVILTGMLDHDRVNEWFLKSSLFVMTSKSEGLPMVLLEAMNMGLPCIAFKTPNGISDIIENDYNGYIIDNDNIDAMVSKINDLLSDKINLRQMGENAKKTCKKFSQEEIVKKWVQLIGE